MPFVQAIQLDGDLGATLIFLGRSFIDFQRSLREIPSKVTVEIITFGIRLQSCFVELICLLLAGHATEIEVGP